MKGSGASKIEQLDALTGLRGLAAIWVVAMHFSRELMLLLPASASVNWFIGQGANAVPMFFILSGFILVHTHRAQFEIFSWPKYAQFIWLRLARIYPTYLATLGLMVGLVMASKLVGVSYTKESYSLARLPLEAVMLQCWWWTDFFGWNYPDWSISAEWFAYLFIFPPAIWLLKKLAVGKPIISGAAALGLLALEPAVRTEWKISMVSLLFLAGAFIWELRHRLQSGKKIPAQLDLLAGGFFFVVLWFAPQLGKYFFSVLFLLATGLLILGLSRAGGQVSRLLSLSPIFFLGEISYSIYLTHAAVQRILKVILPAEKFAASSIFERIAILLVYIVCLFAMSLFIYYTVERPARIWLRRIKIIPAPAA